MEFTNAAFAALPYGSTLFADYSLYSMLNYRQVVDQVRPDVKLIICPFRASSRRCAGKETKASSIWPIPTATTPSMRSSSILTSCRPGRFTA
jgi:hypothetical protein